MDWIAANWQWVAILASLWAVAVGFQVVAERMKDIRDELRAVREQMVDKDERRRTAVRAMDGILRGATDSRPEA